jgi:hypothetical protein
VPGPDAGRPAAAQHPGSRWRISAAIGGAAVHVTASTPVAENGGGILHTVNINTGASGATVTLYDGTSDTGAELAVISAAAAGTFTYDALLKAGLYVALSGSPDVTVVLLPSPGQTP